MTRRLRLRRCRRGLPERSVTGRTANGPAATARSRRGGAKSASASSSPWSAVVVVVGAVILWRFFGDTLSNRSDAAAARCVEGDVKVSVVADPAIAEPVAALAERYNSTADPVGDRCVKISVGPADSDRVVNGFIGKWPADLGERPALWIPASSVSEARLEAAAGAKTVSDSRSLVTSPVGARCAASAERSAGRTELGQHCRGCRPIPPHSTSWGYRGWGVASPGATPERGQRRDLSGRRGCGGRPPHRPALRHSAGLGAVSTLIGGAIPSSPTRMPATALDALARSFRSGRPPRCTPW